MNVINLSLGEPEVDPAARLRRRTRSTRAAAAGVVPVVAADNDFDQYGYGSISSPGERARRDHGRRDDRRPARSPTSPPAGPTPVSLQLKPDVSAPGVAITSSLPAEPGRPVRRALGDEHGDARTSPAPPRS